MEIKKDDLKLIVHKSAQELGESIDKILQERRNSSEFQKEIDENNDYTEIRYISPIKEPRFQNGEGKIVLEESVRGYDTYVIADVNNYSITYNIFGHQNHYSPDDHFMDIERILAAMRGCEKDVTIIMPLLYSSRQHRRKERESLDCAIALQKLYYFYGVKRLITIDAHSPETLVNSVPLASYENIYPTGLILQDFLNNELENIDLNNMIIVSPDTGATSRASFYSSVFQCPLGIFYKQRDYKNVVNGKNKIETQIYTGPDLKNKDVIVVDDMISSGGSLISVAKQLKEKGAKNVYFITTFSLFTEGIDAFNKAYQEGIFTGLYTTNFTYMNPEYKKTPWMHIVDGSQLLAKIIDRLNKNVSLASLVDEKQQVAQMIEEEKRKIEENYGKDFPSLTYKK